MSLWKLFRRREDIVITLYEIWDIYNQYNDAMEDGKLDPNEGANLLVAISSVVKQIKGIVA